MDSLKRDANSFFKVRIYLISAQNLSAMGTVIDFKSRLAGMTAMCTANPYPAIKIGDGKTNALRHVKYVDDRSDAFEGDLNPLILKVYELDAKLPNDWELEISFYDKASVQYADQLIGKTTIDIESRRHADGLLKSREATRIALDKLAKQIKDLQKPGKKTLDDQAKLVRLK